MTIIAHFRSFVEYNDLGHDFLLRATMTWNAVIVKCYLKTTAVRDEIEFCDGDREQMKTRRQVYSESWAQPQYPQGLIENKHSLECALIRFQRECAEQQFGDKILVFAATQVFWNDETRIQRK
jgi:hypothetical protein